VTDVTIVDDQPAMAQLPRLPESLLAPLLDAAGEVLRALPAGDVPLALRPLVGFDRRGMARSAARQQLVKAVEADEGFRSKVAEQFLSRSEVRAALDGWSPSEALRRVADAVERSDLPLLASALYAGRPGGWEFGLGVVCSAHDRSRREHEEADDAKAMQTQLSSLDEARRRAQQGLDDARAELARAEQELRDERRTRRTREEQLEREAEGVMRRAAELEAQVARQDAALDEAVGRAAREAERAQRESQRVRDADAELAELRARLQRAAAPGTGLRYSDLRALADAADLAQRLAAGLGGVVEHARKAMPLETGDEPTPVEGRAAGTKRTARERRPAPVVPGGMVADSPAALEAMVRAPATVLYVDGYNVSKRAWGDDRPADQRERLSSALAGLHARTGCDVTVVFDGADVGAAPPGRRPGVRVLFSAEHEEADALIIREIAALPTRIRVVVVSSDRWVREHAEAQGAVVVSSPTLLAALHA